MIRIGVVGVGNMGRHHARVYYELMKEGFDIEFVGVVDKDIKRAREIANKYGTKAYYNHIDLIKNGVNAVSIAVPTTLHKDISLDFIRNGIHVLVEKPIATTFQDAKIMVEEARKNNIVLMVGHIERFNPAVQKLKELLNRGLLGKPIVLTARRVGPLPPQIKDTGVVIDLAVHDIDIIYYLTGKEITNITVKSGCILHPQKYEDYTVILMELQDTIGIIEANWLTPYKLRKLYITGEKAVAELDYITQDLIIQDKEFTIKVRVNKQEPLKNELKHFIECIKHNKKPIITGEEALYILHVLEKARKIISR